MAMAAHDFDTAFSALTQFLSQNVTTQDALRIPLQIAKPFQSVNMPTSSTALNTLVDVSESGDGKDMLLRLDWQSLYLVIATVLQFPPSLDLTRMTYLLTETLKIYTHYDRALTSLKPLLSPNNIGKEIRARRRHLFSSVTFRSRDVLFDEGKPIKVRRLAAQLLLAMMSKSDDEERVILVQDSQKQRFSSLFRHSDDYALRLLISDILRHLHNSQAEMSEEWAALGEEAADFPRASVMDEEVVKQILDVMSNQDVKRTFTGSNSCVYHLTRFDIPNSDLRSEHPNAVLTLDTEITILKPNSEGNAFTMIEIPLTEWIGLEMSDFKDKTSLRLVGKQDKAYVLFHAQKTPIYQVQLCFVTASHREHFTKAFTEVTNRLNPISESQQSLHTATDSERRILSIKVTDYLSDYEREGSCTGDGRLDPSTRSGEHWEEQGQYFISDLNIRRSECFSDVFTRDDSEARPSNFTRMLQTAQATPSSSARASLQIEPSSVHERAESNSFQSSPLRRVKKNKSKSVIKQTTTSARGDDIMQSDDPTLSKAVEASEDADYATFLDNSRLSVFQKELVGADVGEEASERGSPVTHPTARGDQTSQMHRIPDRMPWAHISRRKVQKAVEQVSLSNRGDKLQHIDERSKNKSGTSTSLPSTLQFNYHRHEPNDDNATVSKRIRNEAKSLPSSVHEVTNKKQKVRSKSVVKTAAHSRSRRNAAQDRGQNGKNPDVRSKRSDQQMERKYDPNLIGIIPRSSKKSVDRDPEEESSLPGNPNLSPNSKASIMNKQILPVSSNNSREAGKLPLAQSTESLNGSQRIVRKNARSSNRRCEDRGGKEESARDIDASLDQDEVAKNSYARANQVSPSRGDLDQSFGTKLLQLAVTAPRKTKPQKAVRKMGVFGGEIQFIQSVNTAKNVGTSDRSDATDSTDVSRSKTGASLHLTNVASIDHTSASVLDKVSKDDEGDTDVDLPEPFVSDIEIGGREQHTKSYSPAHSHDQGQCPTEEIPAISAIEKAINHDITGGTNQALRLDHPENTADSISHKFGENWNVYGDPNIKSRNSETTSCSHSLVVTASTNKSVQSRSEGANLTGEAVTSMVSRTAALTFGSLNMQDTTQHEFANNESMRAPLPSLSPSHHDHGSSESMHVAAHDTTADNFQPEGARKQILSIQSTDNMATDVEQWIHSAAETSRSESCAAAGSGKCEALVTTAQTAEPAQNQERAFIGCNYLVNQLSDIPHHNTHDTKSAFEPTNEYQSTTTAAQLWPHRISLSTDLIEVNRHLKSEAIYLQTARSMRRDTSKKAITGNPEFCLLNGSEVQRVREPTGMSSRESDESNRVLKHVQNHSSISKRTAPKVDAHKANAVLIAKLPTHPDCFPSIEHSSKSYSRAVPEPQPSQADTNAAVESRPQYTSSNIVDKVARSENVNTAKVSQARIISCDEIQEQPSTHSDVQRIRPMSSDNLATTVSSLDAVSAMQDVTSATPQPYSAYLSAQTPPLKHHKDTSKVGKIDIDTQTMLETGEATLLETDLQRRQHISASPSTISIDCDSSPLGRLRPRQNNITQPVPANDPPEISAYQKLQQTMQTALQESLLRLSSKELSVRASVIDFEDGACEQLREFQSAMNNATAHTLRKSRTDLERLSSQIKRSQMVISTVEADQEMKAIDDGVLQEHEKALRIALEAVKC